MQTQKNGNLMRRQYGIEPGFIIPIDKFIDVARSACGSMIEFTCHPRGFENRELVDVLLVTVRIHAAYPENVTERHQYRVHGIIHSDVLKSAISAYLRSWWGRGATFEIERVIYI